MSHTKGEWQVGDYITRNDNKRHLAVWAGFESTVCLVSPKNQETKEDYANAKLIASAPDLLEALQSIVNYWDTPQNGSIHEHIRFSIGLAEQAIKKATEDEEQH